MNATRSSGDRRERLPLGPYLSPEFVVVAAAPEGGARELKRACPESCCRLASSCRCSDCQLCCDDD